MSQKALYDQENDLQWQNSWNYGQSEVNHRCEKAPIPRHFSFLSHVTTLLHLKHNTDLNVFLSVCLLCFVAAFETRSQAAQASCELSTQLRGMER